MMTDMEVIALKRDDCRLAATELDGVIERMEAEIRRLVLIRYALREEPAATALPIGATAKSDGRD